jgi:DNA-binding PadR family transcriptional regulator
MYNKMLVMFVLFRVIDNKTLLVAFDDSSKVYVVRKHLEDDGFIKKITLSSRTKRTTHSKTFYYLTRRGFNYAAENFSPLNCKKIEQDNVILYSLVETKKEKKKYLNDDSTIAIMAAKSGAGIELSTLTVENIYGEQDKFDDEVEAESKKVHLKQFLKDNISEKAFQSYRLFKNICESDCQIVFHTGADVKKILGASNSLASAADYKSGRYRGVIDSPYKSVFLFAPPLFGMSWSKWTIKNEKAANKLWNSVGGLRTPTQIKRSGSCIGLIVDSSKQFSDLYFDIDGIRNPDEKFGGSFDHIYIIPHDKNGVEQLNWLMRNDDLEVNESLATSASESGYYRKDSNQYLSELFQLIDNEENRYTALGYQLDAKIIMQIEHIAKQNPNAEFIVLCFEWQKEYLVSVLPDNVIVRATRRIRE